MPLLLEGVFPCGLGGNAYIRPCLLVDENVSSGSFGASLQESIVLTESAEWLRG